MILQPATKRLLLWIYWARNYHTKTCWPKDMYRLSVERMKNATWFISTLTFILKRKVETLASLMRSSKHKSSLLPVWDSLLRTKMAKWETSRRSGERVVSTVRTGLISSRAAYPLWFCIVCYPTSPQLARTIRWQPTIEKTHSSWITRSLYWFKPIKNYGLTTAIRLVSCIPTLIAALSTLSSKVNKVWLENSPKCLLE